MVECNLDFPPTDIPCIYFLMNDWELIYVGQTKLLRNRINNWRLILNLENQRLLLSWE